MDTTPLNFPNTSPLHVSPAEVESWIVEEDADYIVFNKPGNIVCHPSKNGPWSSLVGAVKESRKMATLHLVSRLDRETSGILIIAKNKNAARTTQMAIEHRLVSKTYLALLRGEMPAPTLVDQAIGKDNTSPIAIKHRISHAENARSAVTFFEPLLVKNHYTLARITPHTGRTHQIRVHAQWLGYPIAGDKLYGPDERLYLEFVENGWGPRHEATLELHRQALHAARLEFKTHLFQRTFAAPLPEDMRKLCLEKIACTPNDLATALALQPSP
ncbi:MAG: RluA family pseudouridine synthase [Puniceicoccales bacterium]|jgi:23S rRNA pseudouridine1911/1915/1917 synthase|nr:RluA family pseudouridine synthase [Puniceicoccales bacterium]